MSLWPLYYGTPPLRANTLHTRQHRRYPASTPNQLIRQNLGFRGTHRAGGPTSPRTGRRGWGSCRHETRTRNQPSQQDKTSKPNGNRKPKDEALLQWTPTRIQLVDRTELKYSETKETSAPMLRNRLSSCAPLQTQGGRVGKQECRPTAQQALRAQQVFTPLEHDTAAARPRRAATLRSSRQN